MNGTQTTKGTEMKSKLKIDREFAADLKRTGKVSAVMGCRRYMSAKRYAKQHGLVIVKAKSHSMSHMVEPCNIDGRNILFDGRG
jgi:hypothetical protein